jgi:oligopeptide transport system substrate-binding protein
MAEPAGERRIVTVLMADVAGSTAIAERLGPERSKFLIGQTFGTPLLERVVPERGINSALSELQRLELVVEERRRPAAEYRFRHGLVREAAYASLTTARRQALHKSVGEALEGLHGEELSEAYGQLARHFAEADDATRASDYLLKAGDEARTIDAEAEAVDYYRRALAFLERTGEGARAREVLLRIGLTHHLSFDFEQADLAYADAFFRELPARPSPAPTERLATAIWRPEAITPGHTHEMAGWTLAAHLFSGLVSVDRELNVVPAVARSFRIAEDGRIYRFALRAEASWSDGSPITAHDFAYTWERMREDAVPAGHLLEPIADATALDDHTLEVRLHEPRSYLMHLLAGSASFPWPRHRCEELGEAWRDPGNFVCNGPFALAEYDEQHALMTARQGWHLPRGNLREIHWDFLESGEADAGRVERWFDGRYDALFVSVPAEGSNTRAESIPVLQACFVGFSRRPPFDDVRVRRAFSHAIDRERFQRASSISGEPAVSGGLLPPLMPAHSHDVGLAHDLDRARQLLSDAGYPGGRGLPEVAVTSGRERGVEDLVAQWAELGASVRFVDSSRPLTELADGQVHMGLVVWGADYPDPEAFLTSIGSLLHMAGDEQLRQARSLQDRRARIRLYNEIEHRWIGEEAVLIPLVYVRSTMLTRPWVDGVWANSIDFLRLEQAVVSR